MKWLSASKARRHAARYASEAEGLKGSQRTQRAITVRRELSDAWKDLADTYDATEDDRTSREQTPEAKADRRIAALRLRVSWLRMKIKESEYWRHVYLLRAGGLSERDSVDAAKANEWGDRLVGFRAKLAQAERELKAAVGAGRRPTVKWHDDDGYEKLKEEEADLELDKRCTKLINKMWRGMGRPTPDDKEAWGNLVAWIPEGVPQRLVVRAEQNMREGWQLPFPAEDRKAIFNRLDWVTRRLDEIERLRSLKQRVPRRVGSFVVRDNVNFGRVELDTLGEVDKELNARLKAMGFKWAPSVRKWVRRISQDTEDRLAKLSKYLQEKSRVIRSGSVD